MKIQFINILTASALVLSITLNTSCKKVEGCTDTTAINYDSEATEDDGTCEYEPEITAKITIDNPEAGTTFMGGDTINIHAMIETQGEIHGYEVRLTNLSTNEEVLTYEAHEHDQSMIHYSEKWVNNVSGHSDMSLTVKVLIDHDGNEVSETVNFHCHPMM